MTVLSEIIRNGRRWIAALRSGNYAQGHDYLRLVENEGPPRYCCLGVGLDILDPSGWDKNSGTAFHHALSQDHSYASLSSRACQALGISKDFMMRLVTLNDDTRADFNRIADVIEAYYQINERNGYVSLNVFSERRSAALGLSIAVANTNG